MLQERYGWFVHFMVLSDGDVLKLDAVALLNVHTALFTLAFKSDSTA